MSALKIVKPYARMAGVVDPRDDFTIEDGVRCLRRIEYFGRISHRSEEAQTPESWKRFIQAVVVEKGDWSIVEHASVTVDMLVDRGITHEVVRHRLFSFTQECVSGDTRLTGNLTIQEVFERNLIGRKIRSSDGSHIVRNEISHVFDKGAQPVFQVVTKSGYRIKTTLAHEFQRPDGRFDRLDNLRCGNSVMVNGRPCLLPISDTRLRDLFFTEGMNPVEISISENSPYASVTRRLRKLGIFRDYRNDKDKSKYNANHTAESYRKMTISVIDGYRNGRSIWNKGLTENISASVKRQADGLRLHHHSNGFGPLNSNWKGGVRKTQRAEARRLKFSVDCCEVCSSRKRLEVHHIDENPANNEIDNLIKLCYTCHQKVHSRFRLGIVPVSDEIVSILYVGVMRVFDLEMKTHHNYVANGFVVHNSTRFVNYAKKVPPSFITPEDLYGGDQLFHWDRAIVAAEDSYAGLIKAGCSPQIARSVFPNALASRIAITGNLRNWRHFLIMCTTKEAHPQMRQVTIPLLEEFKAKIPVLFDDLESEMKQSESMKRMR